MDNSSQDPKKYGLRIYTTIKNGPLDKNGVNELVDFIIPPEEVITNQVSFGDWVQTHSNQEVIISFYSLLTKTIRDIKIKTNPLGSKEGVIGASVSKENWTTANKNVLHVISVKEGSFAQKELGLIPNEDYIVGVKCMSSPIIPLNHDEFSPLEIMAEVVQKNKGNPVKFYIYNKTKGARDVTAVIGKDYYFSLGLEGAYGALHMFPSFEMENNEINNDAKEIKIENRNDIGNTSNNNQDIKESKEEKIINNQNNNNINLNDKNNNVNVENKEKTENEIKENNSNIKEEKSPNKENIEQNQNINLKENDSNNNAQNQIELKESVPINTNNNPTSNNDNINKIVEEISIEKNLDSDIHPQEEEKEKNELKEQKEINLQESTPVIENKENKEEIKIETKKEESIENKEENIQKNEEIKKEEENNNNQNEIKKDVNSEENKKEEKEEKEEEKEDENKNNQSSGNKNKRRKKRNKH